MTDVQVFTQDLAFSKGLWPPCPGFVTGTIFKNQEKKPRPVLYSMHAFFQFLSHLSALRPNKLLSFSSHVNGEKCISRICNNHFYICIFLSHTWIAGATPAVSQEITEGQDQELLQLNRFILYGE
jgi:hypothetical protein